MSVNEYYMPTIWRIRGDIHEMYEVCSNFLDGTIRGWFFVIKENIKIVF